MRVVSQLLNRHCCCQPAENSHGRREAVIEQNCQPAVMQPWPYSAGYKADMDLIGQVPNGNDFSQPARTQARSLLGNYPKEAVTQDFLPSCLVVWFFDA
jgi:hypothetical protein